VPPDAESVVRRTLAALDAHDVATASELVHPDVVWPNAVSTATLQGRDAFHEYWTRRLAAVDVQCKPVQFERTADALVVEVHEVVRDASGKVSYGQFRARREFTFRDGLIAEMRTGRWSL
jgi:ketosteroid isomerase-like protein